MTGTASKAALIDKAQTLLGAHQELKPIILPNIWGVSSARIVAEAAFPLSRRRVATSSKALAGVLGMQDDDSSDPDVIFDVVARIARSVSCPVTTDHEAGYGLAPTELVERLLVAGTVGCNLDDSDHHGSDVLVEAKRQAAFLADVRETATDRDVHIVINARADSFVRHVGDE